MDWAALIIALVKGLIELASIGAKYLSDKQLLDAGAATAILASLTSAKEALDRAKKVRAAVRAGASTDHHIMQGTDDGAKRKPKV